MSTEDSSTVVAVTARIRKRSISSHHSAADNNGRTALIKTKIQKIDGQYKASSTCPVNHDEQAAHDDADEPLIVATLPPLVPDSSKYRTRQDVYDDETGDDQQSNSSLDDSPVHRAHAPRSPMPSTIITIVKPVLPSNDTRTDQVKRQPLAEENLPQTKPCAISAEQNPARYKALPPAALVEVRLRFQRRFESECIAAGHHLARDDTAHRRRCT